MCSDVMAAAYGAMVSVLWSNVHCVLGQKLVFWATVIVFEGMVGALGF